MKIPDDVMLIPKREDGLMQLIRRILPPLAFSPFWTTYRRPFQKKTRITYPSRTKRPELCEDVLLHELVHVTWFRKWWGPWLIPLLEVLLPLPIFFSGRWFVERPAYLSDIKRGVCSIDEAVELLWRDYGWCWPRAWMRRWFQKQVNW